MLRASYHVIFASSVFLFKLFCFAEKRWPFLGLRLCNLRMVREALLDLRILSSTTFSDI